MAATVSEGSASLHVSALGAKAGQAWSLNASKGGVLGLGKAHRPLVKAMMEMRWMVARCGVDTGA